MLDPPGNVAEEHGFDGLRRRYQRDAPAASDSSSGLQARRPRTATTPRGACSQVAHSDGPRIERYAYRLDGELMRAENAATTLEFDRDLLGRIKEHGATALGHLEYDVLGRRQSLRSSKGLEQRIRRNAMGDVLAIEAAVRGESRRTCATARAGSSPSTPASRQPAAPLPRRLRTRPPGPRAGTLACPAESSPAGSATTSGAPCSTRSCPRRHPPGATIHLGNQRPPACDRRLPERTRPLHPRRPRKPRGGDLPGRPRRPSVARRRRQPLQSGRPNRPQIRPRRTTPRSARPPRHHPLRLRRRGQPQQEDRTRRQRVVLPLEPRRHAQLPSNAPTATS